MGKMYYFSFFGLLFFYLVSCMQMSELELDEMLRVDNQIGIDQFFSENPNLDKQDIQGNTLFHKAVQKNLSSVVNTLLDRGANPNVKNHQGDTPLHLAIRLNFIDLAKILSQNGADLYIKNKENLSPLELIFIEKDEPVLYANIINKNNYNHLDSEGNSILHYISRFADIGLANRYLNLGGNINHQNNNKQRSIDVALDWKDDVYYAYYIYFLVQSGSEMPASRSYQYLFPFLQNNNFSTVNVNGENILHLVSFKGHVWFLQFFIEQGLRVNSQDLAGNVPLVKVLTNALLEDEKKIAVINLLAKKKANMNAYDFRRNTILALALMYRNNLPVIESLLKHQANPNLTDSNNNTTLQLAVSLNLPLEVSQALILLGQVNIHLKNDLGETALYLATQQSNAPLVTFLLKKNANPFDRALKGDNSLSIAYKQGWELTKIFFNNSQYLTDSEGNTFVHWLILSGELYSVLARLIDLGLDINEKNYLGQSPLFLAITRNYIDITRLLIEKGAEVYLVDNNANSIMTHLLSQKLEFIRSIFQSSELFEKRDYNQATPLFYAVDLGKISVVKLLLELGADISATNNINNTIYHQLAMQNNTEMLQILLEEDRTNLNKLNFFSNTPTHMSIIYNRIKNLEVLIQNESNLNIKNMNGFTPLMESVYRNNDQIFLLLIQQDVSIDIRDNQGQSPLFRAISLNNEYMVSVLLEKGAAINLRDNLGNTPLHEVILSKNYDLISYLIQKNADIFSFNNQNKSPLVLAFETASLSVIKMLVNEDNINEQNSYGSTPLHVAIEMDVNSIIIDYLFSLNPNLSLVNKNIE